MQFTILPQTGRFVNIFERIVENFLWTFCKSVFLIAAFIKKIIKKISSKPIDFLEEVWYYIYLYGRTHKAHPLRCRGK